MVNGVASPWYTVHPKETKVTCSNLFVTSLNKKSYQAKCQADGTWLHNDSCISMAFILPLNFY